MLRAYFSQVFQNPLYCAAFKAGFYCQFTLSTCHHWTPGHTSSVPCGLGANVFVLLFADMQDGALRRRTISCPQTRTMLSLEACQLNFNIFMMLLLCCGAAGM